MNKCLQPTDAWICGTKCAKDGIVSPNIVFSYNDAYDYYSHLSANSQMAIFLTKQNQISLPCGKCAACQIRKRKDMSVRLCHEASMFDNCCFITLTYDDNNVPVTTDEPWKDSTTNDKLLERGLGSIPQGKLTLLPYDVQCFMKRLRRHLEYIPKKQNGIRDHVEKIRYFAVGEYGSRTHRPHYHIIVFGWKPSDLEILKTHKGKLVYISSQISKLWKFGYSSVSDVNPAVAKYCARYVTKKFARLNDDNTFENSICPEFTLQSVRNGGIGATWFDKYYKSALPTGFVNIKVGSRISKCTIPNYYFMRCRKIDVPLFLALRNERIKFAKSHKLPTDYLALFRMCECNAYQDKLQSYEEVF